MSSLYHGARVGVVAHDAGGAEILASLVQQEALDCFYVLDGPAKRVFENRLGPLQIVSLEAAINQCDWLLTGTGWQTDFEWQAICKARSAGKHTVTFLDHWVNYKNRFIRDGVECLPDEIWVGDQNAFTLASSTFPGISIHLVENPFFKNFINEVEKLGDLTGRKQSGKCNVLFVSENINRENFQQNDVIRFFMTNLTSLESDIGRILIRPHPSEVVDKYLWVKDEFESSNTGISIEFSNGGSLASEIADSDIVVGCSSMAMALGVLVGRRVISCIPNMEMPFTLPFDEIELLADIVKRNN